MFPQHNEKNIVFLLILFILFISINVNALSYSFSGTYFNASSSDIVDQHYGIHGFVIFSNSYIKSGIDRLELRTHGTIHTPINSSIFTKRESYIIPIMVGYRKPISKRIKIHGEVGLNIPIMDTINADEQSAIETEESVFNSAIISNYEELLKPYFSTQIGMTVTIIKNVDITISKSWNVLKNNISYTYLDTVSETKEIEGDYAPLALSIKYSF